MDEKAAGAAGGFACIGHTADVASIARMLDDLESAHSLPRTLLFTLNPADTEVMSVLTGSYSEDGIASKVKEGETATVVVDGSTVSVRYTAYTQ